MMVIGDGKCSWYIYKQMDMVPLLVEFWSSFWLRWNGGVMPMNRVSRHYSAMKRKSMGMGYSASFLKASWYCLQVWARTLSNFCWRAMAVGRMMSDLPSVEISRGHPPCENFIINCCKVND